MLLLGTGKLRYVLIDWRYNNGHIHSEYYSNVYVCWMHAPYNYGYCIIKDTSVSMVILASTDVIMCLILTKRTLISIITLQLSGDVLGRGLPTGPTSNGLLSYYPEYISFGLAGMAENHMCIKYFIKHLRRFSKSMNTHLP